MDTSYILYSITLFFILEILEKFSHTKRYTIMYNISLKSIVFVKIFCYYFWVFKPSLVKLIKMYKDYYIMPT